MASSPYTLEGAREILSEPGGKWLKALDALLGVGVMAAGPFGLAAWGWVDQKNELIKLLGEFTAAGRTRLGEKRTPPERYDLLAATHTALTYGAFFAAFREIVGPICDEIGLTEDDKRRLVYGAQPELAQGGLQRGVANTSIGLPWAGCGFRANRDEVVQPFYQTLTLRCIGFLQNFEVWLRVDSVRASDPLVQDIVGRAIRRYEAEYKLLAADVPEFGIWAALGESEITQDAVQRAGESLSRLEKIMMSLAGKVERVGNRTREVNAAVNRAVLAEPLVATDSSDDLAELRIPTVRDGYLTPTFRWKVMDEKSRPADDNWWTRAEHGSDLDTFLAAYFSSPRSHDRPLVVLGLPGAGKSMFTKVCAARLSGSEAYAVARVPLRQVSDPTAPIHQQVSGVLDKATNGRVSWTELSEAAVDATRVLLIDGLDEFMQASGHAESNYLQNVAEFQRVERLSGHPVSVVVTSRTLVADLARIPVGSLVVKLDNFSPEQVQACLDIWSQANPARPSRIPSADAILSYGEIAQQPLLLLLLILYGSTNPLPQVEAESTPARIYGDILRRFIKRELLKTPDLNPADLREEQTQAELWRLGIAAFGMFNRGRHYIEEHLLLADLEALDKAAPRRQVQRRGTALTAARQLLGKFFFMHAAEVDEGLEGRSYEFLHATFSEYLIASLALDELVDLWESRNRPSSQNWDDDRLYALLSHQLISIGGAAILPFIGQLHEALPEFTRRGVRQILRTLLRSAEGRWDSGRFAAYSPSGESSLQRFATYTANLIMLLLQVEEGPVELGSIAPAEVDPTGWWAKMIQVWQACVSDFDLTEIEPSVQEGAVERSQGGITQPSVHIPRLMFRHAQAIIINAGFGVVGEKYYIESSDPEIAFAGYAARGLTDPEEASNVSTAAVKILQRLPESARFLAPSLLAAHIARNPEKFSATDVRLLMDAAEASDHRFVDIWPYSLLIGQYPQLASDSELNEHLLNSFGTRVGVAPLLAGMLIWGDDRIQIRRIFDALPVSVRFKIEECGAALTQLRGWMDGRRLVILAAELIFPLLKEADLVRIWREMGMPVRLYERDPRATKPE
ncbi:NACHT domain-containing protein [Micromonospora sp. DT53]|uniref:NACHT domain-containing protein n=1 Tax=Micromonospora sp. DT53 TaxID=3393444 RepID=UPI003CF7845C